MSLFSINLYATLPTIFFNIIGKHDIRDDKAFPEVKINDGINNAYQYAKDNMNSLINEELAKESNSFKDNNYKAKANGKNEHIDDTVKDVEKANVNSALLTNVAMVKQPRYGNSEMQQFFIILKRALLFSRRDWVSKFRFLFRTLTVAKSKLFDWVFKLWSWMPCQNERVSSSEAYSIIFLNSLPVNLSLSTHF